MRAAARTIFGRSVRGLAVLPLLSAPQQEGGGRLLSSPTECIRVEVRNDQLLDANIRPYVNGIPAGEKLYTQGLATARFTLRADTYLHAQLQFAIDLVGSDEVYFVPSQSTLSLSDTSALVRITVASRIWLSTLSLVDFEDLGFPCPP